MPVMGRVAGNESRASPGPSGRLRRAQSARLLPPLVGTTRWDETAGAARTRLAPLDASARREEIARMLSAAEVTAEARAQADRLLAAAEAAA